MKKYLAFISYRHQAYDSEIARILRRGLENCHLPDFCILPKRRRVFRDKDELPTSADLKTDIEEALAASGYLVAICSESYVESRWCRSEIRSFIESKRKDRILPVLISGTPETSIPEEIRDIPILCDVRNGGKKAAREAVCEILGKMSGDGAEPFRKAERRFRLRTAGIAAGCALLAILGFASYALYTANRIESLNMQVESAIALAKEEEEKALQERDTALLQQAEFISKQAWQAIDEEDYAEALRLALSALPEDLHGDLPVSRDALAVLRAVTSLTVRLPYSLTDTLNPEFGIRKVYGCGTDGATIETEDGEFLLYDFEDGSTLPYEGVYNWVSSFEERNEVLRSAREEGYTGFASKYSGSPVSFAFYGNDLPMKCVQVSPEGEFFYTLGGEGVTADGAYTIDPYKSSLLVWSEAPARTILFDIEKPEAIARVPLSGYPVSATYLDASDARTIVVCTSEGSLAGIKTGTGEITRELPGTFVSVEYIYQDTPALLAITKEGEGYLLDAFTFDVIYQVQASSPVRKLIPYREDLFLLVLCDDGMRLCNLQTGRLIMKVGPEEAPQDAFWYGEKGDWIAAFYEDRVDLYVREPVVDSNVTDSIPLYDERVTKPGNPLYAPDGSAIYLTGKGIVSKWDTQTGELLWINDGEWGDYFGSCFDTVMSGDGSGIWRSLYGQNGVERIDAQTGQTLFRAEFDTGHGDFRSAPMESPDLSRALMKSQEYSHVFLMMDAYSGEELWRMDSVGITQCVFSEDGKKLYCVRQSLDRTADEAVYLYEIATVDADTGKELSVHPCTYEDLRQIRIAPIQGCVAILAGPEEGEGASSETEGCRIRLTDLNTGETRELTHEAGTSYRFKLGTDALILCWEEENADGEAVSYLAKLNADGSVSETCLEDSKEGRALTVTKEDTFPFCGEEAYLESGAIWSMEDGKMLLGGVRNVFGGLNGSYIGLVPAPDGSSVCIYNQGLVKESVPFVIRFSDLDTLVQKAKAKLEELEG